MNENLNSFIKKIIIPTIATVLLFIITFFVFFIPRFEQTILDKKRETIKELTQNSISILEKYHSQERSNKLSRKEAQKQAISIIRELRYGPENKDYFWITDTLPMMIMHPYRIDLNGTNVSNFKDKANQNPFLLFVNMAMKNGAGYVNYMWQWKDNPRKIVPKLSYVKLYKPWNWIIGTGIYIEDVREEINRISSQIITISILIITLISLILLYIIHQSKKIEDERTTAEKALAQSREKYRSIVEAGREGISMIKGDQFVYFNHLIGNILEYNDEELKTIKFFDIFLHADDAKKQIRDGLKDNPFSFEYRTKIITKSQKIITLTLQISQITYTQQPAFVVAFKDSFTAVTKLEYHNSSDLMVTVKSLNRKLKNITRVPLIVEMNASIQDAILLMNSHHEDALLVQAKEKIVGVVTDNSFKKYILNPEKKKEVFRLMTAPIVTLLEDKTIFDAITLIKEKSVTHIITINADGIINGIVGLSDIIRSLELTYSVILKRIDKSQNIYELKSIYNDVHQLVYTLITSGNDGHQVTKTMGEISDNIMKKVINFALQTLGPAPSTYSFISLGSVARMEQTLFTDQDNALILPDKTDNQEYFKKFAIFINNSLATIGYNKCPGEMMASTDKWRTSLKKWKEYFNKWITQSQTNDLTATSIFFDMRLIQGNQILVNELFNFQKKTINNSPAFIRNLAKKLASSKVPINILGNMSESFDIKQLMRIIVDFVRIYSLKEEINASNTFERLDNLLEKGVFNKKTYESVKNSLDLLTQLRLKHQCELILDNLPPDNQVKLNNLSEFQQMNLKRVMNEIQSYQTLITNQFS